MAAKPIERHVKRQIAEQGGWPRILERIASGETVADISRSILRPDGVSISRSFLSNLLHADPERSAQVKLAHVEGASAMVDEAIHLVDRAPVDRDSVNKAKVQSETRLKVAGFLDRTQYGEAKQAINVNVSVNSLHVDALRHRVVEVSRPVEAIAVEGSVGHMQELAPPLACETDTVSALTDSGSDNGDSVKLIPTTPS